MRGGEWVSRCQVTNLGSSLTGCLCFCSHGSLQLYGEPTVFAKIFKFSIICDSENWTLNRTLIICCWYLWEACSERLDWDYGSESWEEKRNSARLGRSLGWGGGLEDYYETLILSYISTRSTFIPQGSVASSKTVWNMGIIFITVPRPRNTRIR